MLNKDKLIVILLLISVLFFTASAAAFQNGFYTQDTSVTVGGDIYPEFRIFSDSGDIEDNLRGELDISYPGTTHEFKVLLDFQIGAAEEIDFSEAFYRYYGDQYEVLIGKNRVVWGEGDQVHVVDHINPQDLSDFINPDYLDRQLGEEMIKIDRYFRGGNANLEFIYTPDFNGNRLANDPDSPLGDWIINPFAAELSFGEILAATDYRSEKEIIDKVESSIQDEDNQFALRFTDSRRGTDYGFSYYRGYLREPSYDKAAINELLNDNNGFDQSEFEAALDKANIHYDEVDAFGFEMARVIGDINSRFELAYLRTDDTSGDDPLTRNNRIAWVVGGDRNLPYNNLNLNIQFTGEKILDDDAIADNELHIDYDEDGDYTTHRAIVKLEDSYQNERIIPQLTWIYNFKDNDYSLEAAVDYELQQDLELQLSHKIFRGDEDTPFGQFEDNDFTSIALKYSF